MQGIRRQTHQSEAVGLRAIPGSWIPQGSSRGAIWHSEGVDRTQTERHQSQLILDTDQMFAPDLTLTDYGGGVVKVAIDMPWPAAGIQILGRLWWEEGRLYFEELEGLDRSAEFYRRDDGAIVATLRQPGAPELELRYSQTGRCRPGQLRPAI